MNVTKYGNIIFMKNKIFIYIAVILGLAFLALAITYWTTSAGSLPAYFPGYVSGSAAIHFKHGLGSLLLSIALFAYAWFASGKKSANQ